MKIACQSCQAKYTIADEKVLGKVVKIRCKKCGATIVINGNESGAQASTSGSNAEGQSFDYAGAAAIGVVMLAASFVMLLALNGLQSWAAKRQ